MMTETVTAIYENGILRPTRPLKLRDQQRVRIQVLSEEPENELDQIVAELAQSGMLTTPPGQSEVKPMSEQERRTLADTMGRAAGKPLSEIIIEDRGVC
jgi:predicted DNA-binding antitoxin AbrB/MazE fold protein